MTLTLTLTDVAELENGEATQLRLDRHGAIIGRSPHSDWSLPDPKNYVSSTHCEIDYRGSEYVLIDKSTNGTFLNGSEQRMNGAHVLRDGDVIGIGHYRVGVSRGAARAGGGIAGVTAPPAATTGWDAADAQASSDWNAVEAGAAAPAARWGAPPSPTSPSPSGWDGPPSVDPPPAAERLTYASPAADSVWGRAGAEPAKPAASGWDAIGAARDAAPEADSGRGSMVQPWAPPRVDAPAPAAPSPEAVDVWGAMAASNLVDWSRGGFGAPAPATTPVASPSADVQAWSILLAAAGVSTDAVTTSPAQAAGAAGALLRHLVAGLVVMMEARARAKAQLGAQSTTLELKGNNPIKFARSPERVLAQLLNPPERGFMGAADAVEDSFRDLQAHQMATLAAMQGALRATLERFSPEAIRKRAEMRGVLARILPGARNATLWEAYEREFEGVAKGSDEAFTDVFAKAFKAAYEEVSAQMKAQGGG